MTGSEFRTTSWTLILRAQTSPAELASLLQLYWSPVYAYLRRQGNGRADAEDLTQRFITEKVLLDGKLLHQADPEMGSFRGFLKTAVKRFAIDAHRKEHGRDGNWPKVKLASEAELDAAEPARQDDPDTALDKQYAVTLFNSVLESVQAACRAEGKEKHWTVFEERELTSVRYNREPTPYDELMSRLGVTKMQQVYAMRDMVIDKFQRAFVCAVAETLDDPADLASELAYLRRLLAE